MANYCPTCGVNYTAREHHCVEKKICRACGQEKPIASFPGHLSSLDGHKHDCTSCCEEKKQQEKVCQEEYRIQVKVQKQQRIQSNLLFDAYGYHWKKVWVADGEWEPEERFMLYTPIGKQTTPRNTLLDIALLQTHIPGHPSTVWAQEILSLPNVVTLDTETTGFGQDDEIIEIALWDIHKQRSYATLVQCQQTTIPKGAEKKHHITKSMLRDAPNWPQIWPKFMSYLTRHVIIIYNADYDLRMLQQTARRYNLPMPELQVYCLMKQYSAYVGQPSLHAEGHRFLKLAAACTHFQIEHASAHRALADAQAAAEVLQNLAALAQSGNLGIRVEPSLDAPVIRLLLSEYGITSENAYQFLRTHGFTVAEDDERTLQRIQSPTGEYVPLTQALDAIEQKRLDDLAQHQHERKQKLLEDFRKSVTSLREMLALFGAAQNEASAWGYSPSPLAKRLADGTIEVTTYHFEGEWQTTLCQTEEEVVNNLYSDGDGTWDPGEWTKLI
jgi:DNA polymerase III epsilon subunit-like protein